MLFGRSADVADSSRSGLTFAGTGFSEAKLLAYGYAFEQASNHRLERKAYSAAIPKTQLQDV
jgi:amidase